MERTGLVPFPRIGTFLAALAVMTATATRAQDCLLDYTLTFTPPPDNGTYGCGETVTFCLTVNSWNTTNANWIHAVVPTFGPGWDLSTLTPATPPATVGTSGGHWGWYPSVTPTSGVGVGTVGPGFFFDLDNDGNPGNNFGDYATTGPWTFCWTISVASAPDCVNGADLTVTANVFGDSETGSWGSAGCGGDEIPSTPPLQVSACPTAGIGYALVVCEIDPLVYLMNGLTGDPAPGGVWTGPGGQVSDGTLDPATATNGSYVYTVAASSGGNCPETMAVVDVTVNKPPDPGVDAALAVCETDAPVDLFTVLGGTPDAGGSWAWPGGPMSSGLIDPATALSGPYVYTVTGILPCPTLSATIALTVDHLPEPGVDAAFTRCVEAPLVPLFPLLGNGADLGGHWTGPDGLPTDDTFDPAADQPGAYTYTIPATGACDGHSVEAVVTASLFTSPDPRFTVDTLRGCVPLPVGFMLDTPGPLVAAHWYFGDGIFSDELPSLEHAYANTGTFSPRVTVTDVNGCKATWVDTNAVRAYPQPLATFSYTPFPLRTYFDTHAKFTATQDQLRSYEWTIEGLYQFGRTVDHTFPLEAATVYPICLTVLDSIACTATYCEDVEVHDAFFVNAPNAFTPNGDGKNDFFAPFLTGVDVRSLSFQVFDRWGHSVYDAAGPYPNWSGGEGGTGPILPEGVYVWRLVVQDELTAEQRDFIGHVTLLH